MADLFWAIATSYAVLSILAVLLLAALIVGFTPLLGWLPVIGPYVAMAKLVAFLALATLAFLIGFRLADERAEVRQLKADLAYSALQLKAQKATAADAERLRAEAAARAADLNQKVTDYEDKLSKQPAGACALDDTDVRSLRDIAR